MASEKSLYGWLCLKPSWLQPLNHIRIFLIFLFVARALYVGTGDGAVGVVVSTLERRFDLSSSQSSWIASIVDISSALAVALFTVMGTKYHRPKVLAIAILTLSVASFLFTVPHVASPIYSVPANDDTTLCNTNYTSPCNEEKELSYSSSAALATMLGARFLVGAGYPTISIQGFSYLDDAVCPGTYAFYAAVMDISTLAGTTFTYATGSSMLKLHTYFYNPSLVPSIIGPGDSGWIGAWWLLFMSVGMVALPVAAIIAGFPRSSHTLGTPEDQKLKSNLLKRQSDEETGDKIPFYKRPFLRNVAFWMTQVYRFSCILLIFGIAAYSPKYMEIQFNLSPTLAGISLGGVLVLSGTIGSLAGGAFIPKFKLKCKGILKWMTICNVPFFLAFGVFMLNCSSKTIQKSALSHSSNNNNTMVPLCMESCDCADIPFTPVCGADGVEYFSPCHGGCKEVSGTVYTNCSCIADATDGQFASANYGSCSKSTCYNLAIFLIIVAVGFTFACAASAMQNSVIIRCVSSAERTGALGFNTLQCCLGGIAGPVVLGWAFDNSCSVWDYPCGKRGSCLEYNKAILNRNITLLWVIFSSLCVISCFIAWFIYTPRPDESDEAEEEHEISKIYVRNRDSNSLVPEQETTVLITNGNYSNGNMHSKNTTNGNQNNGVQSNLNLVKVSTNKHSGTDDSTTESNNAV